MIFFEIRTVEGSEFLQQALPYWKLYCGAGREHQEVQRHLVPDKKVPVDIQI